MTIFFPDSSICQLATHTPINTTVMVGNSTPYPATDVMDVVLCKRVCNLSVSVCDLELRANLFSGFTDHCKLISGYQTKNGFTYLSYWACIHPAHTQNTLHMQVIMKKRTSVKHRFSMKPSIIVTCNNETTHWTVSVSQLWNYMRVGGRRKKKQKV